MKCPIILLILIFTFIHTVRSYCWEPGKKAGFSGPPRIEQIDLVNVRISWDDVVTQRDCVDQFLVKYWQRSNPQNYLTSDLFDRNTNSTSIKVAPRVDYQFQAVAREDQGVIGGISWNKSPTADFKTSAYNKEVSATAETTSAGNVVTSSEDPTKFTYPTVLSDTREAGLINNGSLPLSIEVLAVIGLVGVAILLVFAGLAYKFFCGKSLDVDEDDDDDDDQDLEGGGGVRDRLDSTTANH